MMAIGYLSEDGNKPLYASVNGKWNLFGFYADGITVLYFQAVVGIFNGTAL